MNADLERRVLIDRRNKLSEALAAQRRKEERRKRINNARTNYLSDRFYYAFNKGDK
jgi:hypothetical protein